MDIVKMASVLPSPVLRHGLSGITQIQKARGQNHFQCSWNGYEWLYTYDDPASLTFFFGATVKNGKTGHEEIPINYFADLGEKHDGVLDLGAHTGSVSVILGVLNPGLPLHCFEPVASNVRVLRKNLAANKLDAEVHEALIGAESGTTTFHEQTSGDTRKLHLYDDTVAHSTSSAYADDPQFQPVKKDVIDLFEFCSSEGISHPFVKIDVEGSERAIVDKLLHGDHDIEGFSAIIELHPDLIDDGNAHDIVLWLEEEGIDIEWVKTRNPRRMALYCSDLNSCE